MVNKSVKSKKLLWCVRILCLIVFVVSAYMLISTYLDYQKGNAAYEELQNATSSDIRLGTLTDDNMPMPIMDFSGLLDVNKDCAAWITLPDTAIDYPVVQGDDNAYYLKHLISGEKNKCGTLFVDYRSGKDFIDKNTIIYGHHMRNGSMFSTLESFKQQSFYDEHSVFILYTPGKTYKLEAFAGIVITADFDNLPLSFASDDAFLNYINNSKENSTFKSDIEITSEDRIVTLCTCTYDFSDARFALLCRLVNN